MTNFTWLHITDFHSGMRQFDCLWPGVNQIFIDDLNALYKITKPWDLILFTGDLAYKGDPDEFTTVDNMLKSLWPMFDEQEIPPKLLAVPGNHDLVRPDNQDARVRQLLRWKVEEEIRDDFWNPMDPGHYHEVLDAAFHNYMTWWKDQPYIPRDGINTHLNDSSIMPGDFSYTLEKENAKLGILGLNSSFLHLNDIFQGDLALDVNQFHRACGGNGPEWANRHHACLLLTHHAPGWLYSTQHFEQEIHHSSRFAVHLYGHDHVGNLDRGPAGTRFRWQAPSLFGLPTKKHSGDERLHGYTLGRIELHPKCQESPESFGKLTFWPRIAATGLSNDRIIVPDSRFPLSKSFSRYCPREDFPLLRDYNGEIPPTLEISVATCINILSSLTAEHEKMRAWKELHEVMQNASKFFCYLHVTIDLWQIEINKPQTECYRKINAYHSIWYMMAIENSWKNTKEILYSSLNLETFPTMIQAIEIPLSEKYVNNISSIIDEGNCMSNIDRLISTWKDPQQDEACSMMKNIDSCKLEIGSLCDKINIFLGLVDKELKESIQASENYLRQLASQLGNESTVLWPQGGSHV